MEWSGFQLNCFGFALLRSVIGSKNSGANPVEYCLVKVSFIFRFSLNISVCFTNKDKGITSYAGKIPSCTSLFIWRFSLSKIRQMSRLANNRTGFLAAHAQSVTQAARKYNSEFSQQEPYAEAFG